MTRKMARLAAIAATTALTAAVFLLPAKADKHAVLQTDFVSVGAGSPQTERDVKREALNSSETTTRFLERPDAVLKLEKAAFEGSNSLEASDQLFR